MLKRSLTLVLLGVGFFVSMVACTKPNAPTNENFVKAIKADMLQHKERYGIYFYTDKSVFGGPVSTNKALYDNKIYIKTAETQRMAFNVTVPISPAVYQAELKRYNWLIKGGSARWVSFSPVPPYDVTMFNPSRPSPPSHNVTETKWRVVHKYTLDMSNKYLAGLASCGPNNSWPACSITLGEYVFDKILSSTQPASFEGSIVTQVEVLMRPSYNNFEKKVEPVSNQLPRKFKMVLVQQINGWKVVESKKVPLS